MSCNATEFAYVHLTSTDLTTAVELTLYDNDGAVITLNPNDRVCLREVSAYVSSDAGGLDIFSDLDEDGVVDAGELRATMGEGSEQIRSCHGWYGPKGRSISVKADSSGAVTLAGVATIERAGLNTGARPDWKA